MFATALLLFIVLNEPHQFSMLDLWEKKCAAGDVEACRRFENARAGVNKLERLDELALRYGENVNRDELEKDGRPLLNLAYKQVMEDFIEAEQEQDNMELNYDDAAVSYCADHFHNPISRNSCPLLGQQKTVVANR